jgi:hypothetical protein
MSSFIPSFIHSSIHCLLLNVSPLLTKPDSEDQHLKSLIPTKTKKERKKRDFMTKVTSPNSLSFLSSAFPESLPFLSLPCLALPSLPFQAAPP